MRIAKILAISLLSLGACHVAQAQSNITIEGYVFEKDNRGYLKNVEITVIDGDKLITKSVTNKDGVFKVDVPAGPKYQLVATKKRFFQTDTTVVTTGIKAGATVYAKIAMERRPGYVFDVTLSETRESGHAMINAVDSARIEIYNNTSGIEELALDNYPLHTFKFTFERGSHYTIMIRKKGFFNKRIEAYVDVADCILCFDGLGTIEPGVLDVMSHGNKMGTFLANVELEPLELNKIYAIENIYYDFDKSNIRQDAAFELDKLVAVLKDNPGISVELGSHTDSRGNDAYNLSLSDKRAKSAVAYLITEGNIDPDNLSSRGYGETVLSNNCKNGVVCSEVNHQANRRTELKIVGIDDVDPLDKKSLKEIIEEENTLRDIMSEKPIKIPLSEKAVSN